MNPTLRIGRDERAILDERLPLAGLDVIEPGCGAARLARDPAQRFAGARVSGLEVGAIERARNAPALHCRRCARPFTRPIHARLARKTFPSNPSMKESRHA